MHNELTAVVRTDFFAFAQRALAELGTQIGHDRYLEYLSTKFTEFISGEQKTLLVNLPPQHLKTNFASIALAAWTLAHTPTAKIIVITHADHLAEKIAYGIRKILLSPWFQAAFATRIAKDRARVSDFATTAGGELFAASFASNITGRPADLIVIDDAHDISHASAPEHLAKVINHYETAVRSRLSNRKIGRVLVVAHRVHEADLSAHLLRVKASVRT